MRAWRAGDAYGATASGVGERSADRHAGVSLCSGGMRAAAATHSERAVFNGAVYYGGSAGYFARRTCIGDEQPGDLCAYWNAVDDCGGAAAGYRDVRAE